MEKRNNPKVFKSCFTAALGKACFSELVEIAQQFFTRPNDMAFRMEVKHFCTSHHLPFPNFPSAEEKDAPPSTFIPIFQALENENFQKWFFLQKITWHTHKGVNEFHVNCQCQKCQHTHLHCGKLQFGGIDTKKILTESISSRGRFFVFNSKINKCCESKIEINKGKFRFIQDINHLSFVYLETNILA